MHLTLVHRLTTGPRMKLLLAVAVALLICGSATAAPDEKVVQEMIRRNPGLSAELIRENYDGCDKGTAETGICVGYQWVEEDMRINQIYRSALEQARKSGAGEQLVKAQRAWIAYRDAQCAYQSAIADGGKSIGAAIQTLDCKVRLTREQADTLSVYLHH